MSNLQAQIFPYRSKNMKRSSLISFKLSSVGQTSCGLTNPSQNYKTPYVAQHKPLPNSSPIPQLSLAKMAKAADNITKSECFLGQS